MRRDLILAFLAMALFFSACAGGQDMPGGGAEAAGMVSAENPTRPDEATPDNGEAQRDAPATENSPRIRAVVAKNCNYVYHMLAVSGCGYENDYGSEYRSLHAEADLQTLKRNERHLTVSGGEHEGKLYFLCVALPASLDDDTPVQAYYEALADLFETGELERNFETYRDIYVQAFSPLVEVSLDSFRGFYGDNRALQTELAEVMAVMRDNYGIYSQQVWDQSLAALTVVASELNKELAKTDYAGKWEEALGAKYGHDTFFALMCNSMENGPQAINITDEKDVFCHSGDYASTAGFISHEFGIYLLMDILADTEAFQEYGYYGLTEGLAEYFNTLVSGGLTDWSAGAEYMDFYKQLRAEHPEITAREMFLRAADVYGPASD